MAFDISRRKLIGGIGLLVAAPYVVKASSLMPIKVYHELQLVTTRGKWKVDISDDIFLDMSRVLLRVRKDELEGAYFLATKNAAASFYAQANLSMNVTSSSLVNSSMDPLLMFRALPIRTQGEA